mgnify:CR=1 FL=1
MVGCTLIILTLTGCDYRIQCWTNKRLPDFPVSECAVIRFISKVLNLLLIRVVVETICVVCVLYSKKGNDFVIESLKNINTLHEQVTSKIFSFYSKRGYLQTNKYVDY